MGSEIKSPNFNQGDYQGDKKGKEGVHVGLRINTRLLGC
jgi:hypothetical protein